MPACLASLALAYALERRAHANRLPPAAQPARHPLELPTAFLFALLLVGFVALSEYALERFGSRGLNVLALIAGLGDVDAFAIALLTGKFAVSSATLVSGIVLATAGNNLLKAGCAAVLGRRKALLPAVLWLIALFAASVFYGFA